MKPIPPPQVAGKTEWERFDNAMRKAISAPKTPTKPETKPQLKTPKTR